MDSIEDLCGLLPETPEDKIAKRKYNAEVDMRFFDLLPENLRNFINFSEVPIQAATVAYTYKRFNYNTDETIKQLERVINDFRRTSDRRRFK